MRIGYSFLHPVIDNSQLEGKSCVNAMSEMGIFNGEIFLTVATNKIQYLFLISLDQ
jgi:hypothetical protein